jgi:hypothetical protein
MAVSNLALAIWSQGDLAEARVMQMPTQGGVICPTWRAGEGGDRLQRTVRRVHRRGSGCPLRPARRKAMGRGDVRAAARSGSHPSLVALVEG